MRRHTISFKNALIGIVTAARTQANIRVHLLIASLVFLLGAYLKISLVEAMILILTVAVVLIAEMANTALEFLSDAVTLEQNALIKDTKDIAAGAVLVAAIFAALIGLIIFIPKIYSQLLIN